MECCDWFLKFLNIVIKTLCHMLHMLLHMLYMLLPSISIRTIDDEILIRTFNFSILVLSIIYAPLKLFYHQFTIDTRNISFLILSLFNSKPLTFGTYLKKSIYSYFKTLCFFIPTFHFILVPVVQYIDVIKTISSLFIFFTKRFWAQKDTSQAKIS